MWLKRSDGGGFGTEPVMGMGRHIFRRRGGEKVRTRPWGLLRRKEQKRMWARENTMTTSPVKASTELGKRGM